MVFLLAERTGWKIDYILWDIPISVLHQANHTFMWAGGIKVRKRFKCANDDKAKVMNLLKI